MGEEEGGEGEEGEEEEEEEEGERLSSRQCGLAMVPA